MSPAEIEGIARHGKVEALKEAAVERLTQAIEEIKMIGRESCPSAHGYASKYIDDAKGAHRGNPE